MNDKPGLSAGEGVDGNFDNEIKETRVFVGTLHGEPIYTNSKAAAHKLRNALSIKIKSDSDIMKEVDSLAGMKVHESTCIDEKIPV